MTDYISKRQRSLELILEAKEHMKEANELLYDVEARWADEKIMDEIERTSRSLSHVLMRMRKAGYEDEE